MNEHLKPALTYVRNTGGGATAINFMEDHNPIGAQLWRELMSDGFVRVAENGRIFTTAKGDEVLASPQSAIRNPKS